MSTMRERALARTGMDSYAQARGFPSARAMELVAMAGAELQSTGHIKTATVEAVVKCYSPGMADQVRAVAREVNEHARAHGAYQAAGLLVDRVAGEGNRDAGYELMQRVANADISLGIEQRLQQRAGDGKAAQPEQPTGDPNSIRANLLRAAGVPSRVDMRPGSPAANHVADRLERADAILAASREGTHEVDRRAAVEAALDQALGSEVGGAVLSTAAVADPDDGDAFVMEADHE